MSRARKVTRPGAVYRGLLVGVTAMIVAMPGLTAERFDRTLSLGETRLEQCGTGELVAYRFFTVGHAALYRQACDQPWALPAKEAATILFRYAREIPAHAFPEAAEEMLARNIHDSQLKAQMPSRLEAFHAAYEAVDEGDLYQISYQQDLGLSLMLNQKQLAVLEDGPLARLYFSIWLGDDPFDEDLKDDLLGQ
ncbi:chalcone isomerase family protein [Allohahella marinimesophila]|uniref:Chalcone isomerase domain-containing protein n=1 Tax=Allohahella marinimesophila TaxID=1054972 RepID=A0ABP7PDF6_9GAMM